MRAYVFAERRRGRETVSTQVHKKTAKIKTFGLHK